MSENCQTSAGETQQGTSCAPLAGETFAAFVDTIAALRAPNGCPWTASKPMNPSPAT